MALTPSQTERLTLRVYTLSDIPALMPLIGAREGAATTLRIPHPYAESDARDYIASTEEACRAAVVCAWASSCVSVTHCGAGWDCGSSLTIVAPNSAIGSGCLTGERAMPRRRPKAVVKYGFGTPGCTHLRQPLREQSCVGQES